METRSFSGAGFVVSGSSRLELIGTRRSVVLGRRAQRVARTSMGSATVDSSGMMSWEDMRKLVSSTGERKGIEVEQFLGDGDPNSPLRPANTRDGSLRLFGKKEEDIRVTLYRDPAYWCPYCQRITLQLEHKQIPYRIRMINMRCYGKKPSYYLVKVPSGLLPAVEIDGRFITESSDIMLAIEDSFPENTPLLPNVREGRPKGLIRALMALERDCFGLWCGWLFRSFGSMNNKNRFESAMQAWSDALEKIDSSGPFLLGKDPCLVDLMAVPFFERFTATTAYWKGYSLRGSYPVIDRWMTAMEENVQAFHATKADYYSTVHDIPPQYGTAFFDEGTEPSRRIIDGLDGSWDLPLNPSSAHYLEPVEGDDTIGRMEAAAAVARTGPRLTRFALRGVGERPRTVTAQLADPDAIPGDGEPPVDIALRILVRLLLDEQSSTTSSIPEIDQIDISERSNVVRSLAYFRDRIGVPRDMSAPAARQLRAHINRLCELLVGAEQWSSMRKELEAPVAK